MKSQQVYDRLLKLYPKRFQEEFAEEMKFVFSELLNEASANNRKYGVAAFWMRTLADAGGSLVRQHMDNLKGAITMKPNNTDIISQNRIFLWIALVTGLLLMIPLIWMQFDSQVYWTASDFVAAGVLLFGMGSLYVLAARRVRKCRLALGVAFFLVLAYIWAELAVGVFTNLGS